jgi:hypothetical protein
VVSPDPEAGRASVIPLDEYLQLIGVVHAPAPGDAGSDELDPVSQDRDLYAFLTIRPHA